MKGVCDGKYCGGDDWVASNIQLMLDGNFNFPHFFLIAEMPLHSHFCVCSATKKSRSEHFHIKINRERKNGVAANAS